MCCNGWVPSGCVGGTLLSGSEISSKKFLRTLYNERITLNRIVRNKMIQRFPKWRNSSR